MKTKKLAILLIFSLFGCGENGTVTEEPKDFIIIHGKTYKLMQVCAGGSDYLWIMYPKDSLDNVPQTVSYKSGKKYQTIIKVE